MPGRERALVQNGVLTASEAALYQVEAGARLYVHALVCQNPSTADTNTVSLYVQPSGGTSRLWTQVILAAGERVALTDHQLSGLDTVRGAATNADQVVWTLSGMLESLDL